MEKEHHEVTEVKEIFEGTELAKGKTYNLKDLTGSYLIKAINENNYSPERECNYYSIPFLDFQKESGLSELNIDVLTSDELHPNEKFFELKKYSILNFLESL